MGYDTAQSGVIPRQMPNANYTGAPDEVMISYCNGVKCLVIHDGVTPGGCWRVCAGGGGGCGGGCAPDCSKCDQHVLNLINNWFNENHMGGLKDWNVTKGPDGQHADDNILHLIFGDGSQWDIDLFDDDGVVGISWDEDDRELTVTMDDGTTKILTIGDKYARLNAAGDTIIFPDGRTWRHCCAEEFRGTCGCDYPANPSVGDVHLNGGNSGCIKRFDGENWVNIARIRPGDKFFCTDTRREFTANGTCNWVETSDTICDRPLLGDKFNNDVVFIPVEPCVVPPCDCEGDPNCECFCEDALEPKQRVSLTEFAKRITETIFENMCLSEPQEFDGCGSVKTAIMFEDEENPGCWKLGVYSQTASDGQIATPGKGHVNQPLNELFIWPDDFGANRYTVSELYADDEGGTTTGGSGTIDETRIAENIVSGVTFQNPCRTRFEIVMRLNQVAEATAEAAYQNNTWLYYRYRVDNGNWIYSRNNTAGGVTQRISRFYQFNGITAVSEATNTITLPAGLIDFQMLALAPNPEVQGARFNVGTYEPGTGIPAQPTSRLRVAADS